MSAPFLTPYRTTDGAKQAARRGLAAIADQYFAPLERLGPVEWLEQHVVLPPGDPRPGNLSFAYTPLLRDIVRTMCSPGFTRGAVAKGSQMGFTVVVLTGGTMFKVVVSADGAAVAFPTERDAIRYSKTKLTNFIAGCQAAVKAFATVAARDPNDTILYKRTRDGTELFILGMESSSGLRSFTSPGLGIDEIDELEPDEQGDPIDRLRRAQIQYDQFRRWEITGSTPTVWRLPKLFGEDAVEALRSWRREHHGRSPGSRIWQMFLEGDQRRWYAHCPHCRHRWIVEWQHIRWPKEGPLLERANNAYCCCPGGGCEIRPELKEVLVGTTEDRWAPHNTNGLYPSWHLNGLYSFAPDQDWRVLAREFLLAGRDPARLKPFLNQRLGLPYEDRSLDVVVDPHTFRRDDYGAEVPASVGLITIAVDVQRKRGRERLEVLVKGWGAGEESWNLHHFRLFGDVTQLDPTPQQPVSPWMRLDDIRRRYWAHAAGGGMRASLTGIDSADGEMTDLVYRYVRARAGEGVIALRGEKSFKGQDRDVRRQLIRESKADSASGLRLVLMNTYAIRSRVYQRLGIRLDGPGCIHWPRVPVSGEFDAEYFEQFKAEVKDLIEHDNGAVEEVWTTKGANEAPDLEVQSLATFEALGADVRGQLPAMVAMAQQLGAALRAQQADRFASVLVTAERSESREISKGFHRPRRG